MPWIPLHESGIPYEFFPDTEGLATLNGSIVTSMGDGFDTSGWVFEFESGAEYQLRLTPVAWSFPNAGSIYHEIWWNNADGFDWVENASASPEESFEPAPIELTAADDGPDVPAVGFYVDTPSPGINVQWLLEVFTPCFWKEPVLGATQSCDTSGGGGGDATSNFTSRIVGSGGGFILQKSDWTGPEPNIIRDALDLETDGTITHSWDGGAWVAVSPTVPIYYGPTGFGPDPEDPGDTRVLVCNEGDWNATGLPSLTPTLVRIDFGLAGIAEGTVESAIGS